MKERKENTLGIGVNDAPIWLVKGFSKLAKEKYNDTYWVCLMDIMRKAEAYDNLVVEQVEELEQPQIEVEEDEGIQTFAGKINKGD